MREGEMERIEQMFVIKYFWRKQWGSKAIHNEISTALGGSAYSLSEGNADMAVIRDERPSDAEVSQLQSELDDVKRSAEGSKSTASTAKQSQVEKNLQLRARRHAITRQIKTRRFLTSSRITAISETTGAG
jgi:hypothetical protein